MNGKELTKSVLAIVLILVIAVGLLFGINLFTAPIIAKNGAAAQYAPLLSVMPDAQNFESLYDINDRTSSSLVSVPETVQSIYSETSGLGYVVRLSTTEGYTHDPMELTMAVDSEGRISGIEVNTYPDSKDFGKDYPGTYLGQDSAMAGVTLVGGVTYSSSAFKNAVADGFSALISNDLIGAGVKSDDQVLMEMLAEVYPGIANYSGIPQYEQFEASGSIVSGMKALNGSGVACIVSAGDVTMLGVGSVFGSVKLVNAEGTDVTSDYSALADEIIAAAEANAPSFTDTDMRKTALIAPEGAELAGITLDGVYNSVTTAYSITAGDEQFYGFVARPYGYSNELMVVYYVLDSNGAIVNMSANEFILFAEYYSAYTLDETQYKAGFSGLTADSFTGEQALISGATVSSEAIKAATDDVFAAFASINLNGGANE